MCVVESALSNARLAAEAIEQPKRQINTMHLKLQATQIFDLNVAFPSSPFVTLSSQQVVHPRSQFSCGWLCLPFVCVDADCVVQVAGRISLRQEGETGNAAGCQRVSTTDVSDSVG